MDGAALDAKRARNQYETNLLEHIRRDGIHVTIVGAAEEDDDSAVELYGNAFAYSVGMNYSFSEPDIIVVGLGFELMHSMVNGIRDFVASGNKLHDGMLIPELLVGYQCCLRVVTHSEQKANMRSCEWFYGTREFPAMQCVWPAAHPENAYPEAQPEIPGHVFPWTPGASLDFRRDQPLLFDI
jgi:hypothetical protein